LRQSNGQISTHAVRKNSCDGINTHGALGRVLLHAKRLGNKNWGEFEPPALQKEE
jgi:hypothetical protein